MNHCCCGGVAEHRRILIVTNYLLHWTVSNTWMCMLKLENPSLQHGSRMLPWILHRGDHLCLLEVRAMVVTAQQPLAKCTAIATMCIVEHRPAPCAVKIYKTCTDEQGNEFQDIAPIQDRRSMCWQYTNANTLILTDRLGIDRGEQCNDRSNSCRNGEHL